MDISCNENNYVCPPSSIAAMMMMVMKPLLATIDNMFSLKRLYVDLR